MKTNATIEQLNEALSFVNKTFAGNIKFKNLKQISKNQVRFTLGVNDSKEPGHRRGYFARDGHKPKRLAAACWHVHGYFFEYLFLKYPNIKIYAGALKMVSNYDNWQDRNIGSNFEPLQFSDACDCHKAKTRYIHTDGWRGYSEPVNAVCGANNTGSWSDSPCPESVCLSELDEAKKALINAKIPYTLKWCETSNVFCIHGYLLVSGKARRERAKELIKPLIENTRLLYVCN